MNSLGRRQIFFGWKVVAAAFTIATLTFGFGFYGPPVFLTVLHNERHWAISTISYCVTVHFLTSALLVPNLPWAHRKFGICPVTFCSAVMLVIGMYLWTVALAPWELGLFAIISGIGWAGTNAAAIIAMVSPWFERRRSTALNHALNGASVGGIVFAPLWVVMVNRMGFNVAVALIGVATLAILAPLSWGFLRPTPASLAMRPDGDRSRNAGISTLRRQPKDNTLRSLLADVSFLSISAAFALGMFAQVGVISQFIARLAPVFGPVRAASALSLLTLCAVIGRAFLGVIVGDSNRRRIAALNFILQAIGVLLLALGSSAPVLLTACVFIGVGTGGLLSLPPLIAQTEFAPSDVGRIVALVVGINQAVFSFAPAVIGLLRGVTGSYSIPFSVAAVSLLCAATIILAGTPRHAFSAGGQT